MTLARKILLPYVLFLVVFVALFLFVMSRTSLGQEELKIVIVFFLLNLFLLLAFSLYIRSSVIHPLVLLMAYAKRLAQGHLSFTGLEKRKDEIGQLAASFADMGAKLAATYERLEEKAERSIGALAASEEQFARAFHDSSVGMCLLSADRLLLKVNPAAERLLGYAEGELSDLDPIALAHPEDKVMLQKQMQDLQEGIATSMQCEARFLHRQGFSLWVMVHASLVRGPEGKLLSYIVQFQDIHSRKVEEMAQSEFVALASHQLRTPLTAVRWTLGRVLRTLRGKIPDGDLHLLGEARKASINLAVIIDAMLMISQIEAGKVTVRAESIFLRELFFALREEFRDACREKRIGVRVDVAPSLAFSTDRALLRECLANLFSNAVKYTPRGGQITLAAELLITGGERVRFMVSDTGVGIPAHQQDRVFTKFFRGDNVLAMEPNGTGLGLYLVATIARLLGGSIAFRSREGEGTAFMLTLPDRTPFR